MVYDEQEEAFINGELKTERCARVRFSWRIQTCSRVSKSKENEKDKKEKGYAVAFIRHVFFVFFYENEIT